MFTKINARKRKYGFLTSLHYDINIVHVGQVLDYLMNNHSGGYITERNFSYGKSEFRIYTDDAEVARFIEMNFVSEE